MTHTGKIARLSLKIREELNTRLANGQHGKIILAWLNALPEVREILSGWFDDKPVNHVNLTNWRQGGYQEWLSQCDRDRVARELTTSAKDVNGASADRVIAKNVSYALLAQLASSAMELRDQPAAPSKRTQQLSKMLLTVSKVRRDDCRDARIDLDWEHDKLERAKMDHRLKFKALAVLERHGALKSPQPEAPNLS